MSGDNIPVKSWKASLHGGHSSRYCDHAHSTLEEILDAAITFGYTTFGVTEHAPRIDPELLFTEELAMGWTVETLDRSFQDYAVELDALVARYAGRLEILKGFEAEVAPADRYAEVMRTYKERFGFDYMVGSVHYVGGLIVDYTPEHFRRAAEQYGGLEGLGAAYYQAVADMVHKLKPDVIGHFDLISLGYPDPADAETPRIRRSAFEALEIIRDYGAILDINTAGYRKGLGRPFPASVHLRAARDLDIPVCFGDDSHRTEHVGAGLEDARRYLLQNGYEHVTVLERGTSGLNRRQLRLDG